MKKSKAFTLAEVLITLVIIGVIAAMTIPTLMGSTNQQEIKSKLKKAVSSINQALALEYALYGNNIYVNGNKIANRYQIAQMLQNHLSIIDVDEGANCQNEGENDRLCLKSADGIVYQIYNDGHGIDVLFTPKNAQQHSYGCGGSDLNAAKNFKPNSFCLVFLSSKGHEISTCDIMGYSYLYDTSVEDAWNQNDGCYMNGM